MSRHFSILGAFLVIVIVFIIVRSINTPTENAGQTQLPTATLTVGGATFSVEIADEPVEQAQGLSGRASLGEGEGMLFIFSEPGTHTFWMKDMRFPLDLVWIRGTTVVGITENAPPEGEHPALTYGPPEAVDKVLEISAGSVEKFDIKNGDKAELFVASPNVE